MNNKAVVENKVVPGSKITSILTHMKNFSQQYLTLATFVGIFWGAFVLYDNWKDNNEKMQDNIKTILNSQAREDRADSLLSIEMKNLRQDFEDFKNDMQLKGNTLNSIQKSYVKYLSKDQTLTKKDFVEYMEGLTIESKKN
jgi:hypothetical protein